MPKSQKIVVEVKNLIKRYKKAQKNAIDNISFTVHEGEFFALLGPNGAGKTTTISILTTTLAKTSGEIIIAGYDLEKNASAVRKNIGIIFQNQSLDQNLSAEENIRLHSILYGLYPFAPTFSLMPESYQKKVEELASVLDIQKDIHRPIKTFSGGMKRKLEIIRSLMHKPKILFLDEPTSGLDPLSRKSLWNYLKTVRENEKTTIFLTTHYLEEAEDADTVCIINKGKIVSIGTPQKIKRELVKKYLDIDAHDRAKLVKELEQNRFTYIIGDTIKIDLSHQNAQEVIQSIKTPLTYLNIHNPTLEEAYLEVIEGNQENHA
jgi:ABC-2 type transport system ATP-binding protein